MILKSFVNYLINKYLKNYIERLDDEKVKLSLSSGKIFMEKLRLKPEALVVFFPCKIAQAYLNVPVAVVAGYIERLEVLIPWNSLATQPTRVLIDGFYVLIVPRSEIGLDMREHTAEKSRRVQKKLKNLRKAALDEKTTDDKESALVVQMKLQVMRNVIFTVRNLHISYETKSAAKLGHPFSFGLTIHLIRLTSAAGMKQPKRMKEDTTLSYQIDEVNCASFYWNTNCKSRLDLSFEDQLEDLKSKVATDSYKPDANEMKYVLHPSSFTVESEITLKPKRHHYERSLLECRIQVPNINFRVDSEQISDILDFLKFQRYTTVYDRCHEYRELLLQESLGLDPLDAEQKQRILFLESKLEIFHLAYIRHKVEAECRRYSIANSSDPLGQDPETSMNPGPTGGIAQALSAEVDSSRASSWSKMKSKFSGFRSGHRNTRAKIPKQKDCLFQDAPKIDIQLSFNKIDVALLSPATNARFTASRVHGEELVRVCLTDAQFAVKKMCITSRIEYVEIARCLVTLQSLHVFGMRRDKHFRPILINPLSPSSSPFVRVEFELFSVDPNCDNRLNLTVEPLKVVYDAPTISQLVECFEANPDVSWRTESKTAAEALAESEREASHREILDVTLNLKGLVFLLPECGVLQRELAMIRIGIENVSLMSGPDGVDEKLERPLPREDCEEQQLDIKYRLSMKNLRVSYVCSKKARVHLLRRAPQIDVFFHKCASQNSVDLASWRLCVQLILGDVQLSKVILTRALLHLKSVPLIYSNVSTILKRINFYFALLSPFGSYAIDASVRDGSLILLRYPRKSITADFCAHLRTANDGSFTDMHAAIDINNLQMLHHTSPAAARSSRTFFRAKHLKLLYDNCDTKL